tara:strand:- start:1264 stop:2211 length:948 start_codon:yes stop_codon:yes gene_type:complete
MIKKAIIISISGHKLTNSEVNIFKNYLPWGVILFRRNIKNFNQLKELIQSIKKITKDKKYPILIDEEGGEVSRLQNIINNKLFSQRYIGQIYEINANVGISIYKRYINEICTTLNSLGININTVPVLDLLYPFTHNFLKNRLYSSKIKTIQLLSNICIKTYMTNKVSTVIKHMPGHGLAKFDSHKKLPIINKNINFLLKNDFKCFKNNKSLFAMTAHVLFKKIDKINCVTHSKIIINDIIRKQIGYKGIIISDDISMKSLKDGLVENALKAIKAGCNLALYCQGISKDSLKLLRKIPPIDEFTKKKTSEFYNFLR